MEIADSENALTHEQIEETIKAVNAKLLRQRKSSADVRRQVGSGCFSSGSSALAASYCARVPLDTSCPVISQSPSEHGLLLLEQRHVGPRVTQDS